MENKWKNPNFLQSLKNAINGILSVIKSGKNIKIQLVLAIIAIMAGFIFKITNIEFLILILTIFFVLVSEFMNTARENLCDLYTTEYNEKIKLIKDIGAGAVTLSAIASVCVGLIMFLPKVLILFR